MTPWCVLAPQVRDYEFDQEMQSNQSEASKSLKANADKKRKQLEEWSASAYGEVPCSLAGTFLGGPTAISCLPFVLVKKEVMLWHMPWHSWSPCSSCWKKLLNAK